MIVPQSADQYVWENDYPVLYTNWGNNQPNVTNTDNRCVELNTGKAGGWFSRSCDAAKPFMCKHYDGESAS